MLVAVKASQLASYPATSVESIIVRLSSPANACSYELVSSAKVGAGVGIVVGIGEGGTVGVTGASVGMLVGGGTVGGLVGAAKVGGGVVGVAVGDAVVGVAVVGTLVGSLDAVGFDDA